MLLPVSLRTSQAWAQRRDSETVTRLIRWVLLVTLGEAVGFSVFRQRQALQ